MAGEEALPIVELDASDTSNESVGANEGAAPGPGSGAAQPTRQPRLSVEVVDQRDAADAGLQKVAFLVRGVDGPLHRGTRAKVSVDYSSFAEAYGGEWSQRLGVVFFSACWLNANERSQCPAPIRLEEVVNDVDGEVLTFELDFAELMERLAGRGPGPAGRSWVMSGTTGGPGFGLHANAYPAAGNYATTDFSSTGSWSVGVQSGNFSYSFPMEVPAPPNGPTPQVGLSYSSQAVDGLTSNENTQGGLLGPGWSMGDMFIERRFRSCTHPAEGGNLVGDLCYVDDNAFVSMAGVTGELVRRVQPVMATASV